MSSFRTTFLCWGKIFSIAIVVLTMSLFPLPLVVLADTSTTTEDRFNFEERACTTLGGVWVNGACEQAPAPPSATDVCPNVAGDQESGPCADDTCVADGGTWNGSSCDLPSAAPLVDICPNVSGTQTTGPCADVQCDENGGTWTGDACSFAVVDTTPSSVASTDSAEVPPEESDTDNSDFADIGTPPTPDPNDTRPVVDLSATSTEMEAEEPQFVVEGDDDNTGSKTGGTIFTGNATAGTTVENTLNITRANVDGPGKTNSSKITASAENWAELTTTDDTNAFTGENNASGGDQGSATVKTGKAVSTAEVMNVVNTNLFNSNGMVLFLNPMNGDGFDLRNFDLSYFFDGGPGASPMQYGCTILTCLNSSDLKVLNKNEALVKNTVDVHAETGKNAGTAVEEGDVSIETGDAYAAANVLNLVNTNFVNSSYLMLSFNNFGDLNDDIVLPGASFFEDLLASGNTLPQMNSSSYVVSNDNDENFYGTTTTYAITGENVATSTALGHGDIVTGNAYTSSNSYTAANQTRVGGASVLLSFRVWGQWSGSIQGLPDGMTWRATRSSDNTSWLIEIYSQGSTSGAAGGGIYNSSDFMASSTNKTTVQTDVNVWAVTGRNSTETENGVGSIRTGDAYAAANVINLVNTNIVNRNWIFASFNIFGDWSGDIAFGSHSPDLTVDIATNGTNPYPPAGDFQYRFSVKNNGDAPASNVNLTADYNKTLLNFVRSTPLSANTSAGRSWNLGTIAAGATKEVTMDMRILVQSLGSGNSLSTPLTAHVSGTERDQNDGDNSNTFSILISSASSTATTTPSGGGSGSGSDTGGTGNGDSGSGTGSGNDTGSGGDSSGSGDSGGSGDTSGNTSGGNTSGNSSGNSNGGTSSGNSSNNGNSGGGGGGGGVGSALASGNTTNTPATAPRYSGGSGSSGKDLYIVRVKSGISTLDERINGGIDPMVSVQKDVSIATTTATTTVNYQVIVKNAKKAQPAYRTILTDTLYDPKGAVVYARSWPLDTLVPGDEVTLTYAVEFGKTTMVGTYKNVARVTGQRNNIYVEDQIIMMPAAEAWGEVEFAERQPQVLGATAAPAACIPLLTKFMRLGMRDEEVKKLQIFLNSAPDTMVATSGVGSPGNESIVYGSRTVSAVKIFQQKYASEILTPNGLTQPTGSVYGSTLKKINELACGIIAAAPSMEPAAVSSTENTPIEETQISSEETPAPVPAQKSTTKTGKTDNKKSSGVSNEKLLKSFGSWFSSFVP